MQMPAASLDLRALRGATQQDDLPESFAMNARIYQIQKNAMQSGKALTHKWVLDYAPAQAKTPDPLTGWAGSGDTQQQLKLSFPSQEAAIAYAQKQGIAYTVIPTPPKTLKLQAYADNFR
jgi:hypothetical protein|tara:strand:- start:263 stop:622 length:360 start_codon:yes stop_codon:yes gene_type:complete